MIVMYVDDERDLLDIFMRHMNDHFPRDTCLIFHSPRDAMEFLKEDADLVDIIVSDENMPEMNGTDFLLRVVAAGYQKDFIIFSGNCDDNVSFNLLKAELSSKNSSLVARMVEKPNFDLLMQTMKQILEGV